MEIEPFEKELQIWNRFMYMSLGAAVAMLASSPDNFSFAGIVWFFLQVAITPPGFFLLLGKRWKDLPLTKERINTVFGYLVASLLLLFVPVIFGADLLYYIFPVGYFILILFLYLRIKKKPSDSEEMFP